MAQIWNVLVVDDEEDVHAITRIALKRKLYRSLVPLMASARMTILSGWG